jgi:hypothetical protein
MGIISDMLSTFGIPAATAEMIVDAMESVARFFVGAYEFIQLLIGEAPAA